MRRNGSDSELSAHRDRSEGQRHRNEGFTVVAGRMRCARPNPLSHQPDSRVRKGLSNLFDRGPIGSCRCLLDRRLSDHVSRGHDGISMPGGCSDEILQLRDCISNISRVVSIVLDQQ